MFYFDRRNSKIKFYFFLIAFCFEPGLLKYYSTSGVPVPFIISYGSGTVKGVQIEEQVMIQTVANPIVCVYVFLNRWKLAD